MPGRLRGLLLAMVLALAVVPASGCTAGGQPSSAASPSSVASTPGVTTRSPEASPTLPPPAPGPASCYRLLARELARASSSSPAVPCGSPHTARTIYVGMLAPVTDGTASTGPTAARPAQVCPGRLAGYLGGSAADRQLSRFDVVWFTPTAEQVRQGAAWYRCDLVAFAGIRTLYPLPRRGDLRGVLDHADALRTYGRCGTAAPGTKTFTPVICAHRHSWRAFAIVPLRGGQAYPGQATVRGAGDDICRHRARALSGGALKFRYGWEWPSAQQWAGGQHYGFCWVPS